MPKSKSRPLQLPLLTWEVKMALFLMLTPDSGLKKVSSIRSLKVKFCLLEKSIFILKEYHNKKKSASLRKISKRCHKKSLVSWLRLISTLKLGQRILKVIKKITIIPPLMIKPLIKSSKRNPKKVLKERRRSQKYNNLKKSQIFKVQLISLLKNQKKMMTKKTN